MMLRIKFFVLCSLFAISFSSEGVAQSGCGGQFPTNSWCGNPSSTSKGLPSITTLNANDPKLGSWWSNVTPFTQFPLFKVRDRLCVDDGCLINSTFNIAGVLPNTRNGTAINQAGGGWINPPFISSLYVLSSNSNVAISAQNATRMQTTPGAESGIALLGMMLADHPTLALPAWGAYLECARISVLGTCFGTEIEIGNIQNVVPISVYGPEANGITSGIHLHIGGALDQSTHTYTNASVAMDIGFNNSQGAKFDRGIIFLDGAVADQGGGVINALNFPTSNRINWFRNNSGTEQLQAYITASNTTVGSPVQSINFGSSNLMTLTAPGVQVTGQFQAISGSSGSIGAIGVGRTTSDGGLIAVAASNQVLTGTVAGDVVFEAGTNLWLTANNAAGGFPAIKMAAGGGIAALSGSAGAIASFGLGRTTPEGGLIVPASANQVFTGTVAGDFVVEAATTLWLASNNGAGAVPGIKIATTGLLTFPQYGAGVLQSSSAGVISSSLNLTGNVVVLSGANGTVAAFGVGRTLSEGGIVVPASANQVFTGSAIGDTIVQAGTTLWLAANAASAANPGIKIATTGLLTFPQYGAGVLLSSGAGVITAVTGVTCSGAPTGSFASTNGVVTHC